MRRQLVFVGLTLVSVVLPVVAADAPEVEQARTVATQVLEETKSVLEGALKDGQPAARPGGLCLGRPEHRAEQGEQQGWRVRRVSEKVRNPADAPDAEELAVLRAWQDAHTADRLTPITERLEIVTAVTAGTSTT